MRRLILALSTFACFASLGLPAVAGEFEEFRAAITDGDAVLDNARFDHYTMYFEAGSTYELQVATPAFQPTITVVDLETGEIVASATRKVGRAARLDVEVSRSDTYMVMVIAEDGKTGGYDIRIEEID